MDKETAKRHKKGDYREGDPCPDCTKRRVARGAEPWPLARKDNPDGSYLLKCLPCNWRITIYPEATEAGPA